VILLTHLLRNCHIERFHGVPVYRGDDDDDIEKE
jgi:hypothetical protein